MRIIHFSYKLSFDEKMWNTIFLEYLNPLYKRTVTIIQNILYLFHLVQIEREFLSKYTNFDAILQMITVGMSRKIDNESLKTQSVQWGKNVEKLNACWII